MKLVPIKHIIFTTIVLAGMQTYLAKAQDRAIPSLDAHEMLVTQADTYIIKKGVKPADKPLAEVEQAKAFKPVPLASNKTYFGTKSFTVNKFVRNYLKSHNKTLSVVQERSLEHFPVIDQVLDEYKVPRELKYLSVIESALNNNARSPVGAVGPWQFMASTGRLMGLRVNRYKDERKDWLKSTHAAAKYLTMLYEDLDDWLLVVAAYNSGPRPVIRAINKTGSTNFWDIKPYLPRETQNHVLRFVATATIFEDLSELIGSSDIPAVINYAAIKAAKQAAIEAEKNKPVSPYTDEELANMAIVRINAPISFDLMEMELNIDNKLLRKWNIGYEDFVYSAQADKQYQLRIPKDKLNSFLEKKEFLTKRSIKVFSSQNM
ncbi:MAG: lytic transglycosylase domain-containing protein [Flavipsychrobacter sp.]